MSTPSRGNDRAALHQPIDFLSRVGRPATPKGNRAMSGAHLHIQQIHAESRRRDLLAEADRLALVDAAMRAGRERPAVSAAVRVRHALGVALVRVGHRLQDAHLARPEAAPTIGRLRVVR